MQMKPEYNYFLFLVFVIISSGMLHLIVPFPFYFIIPLTFFVIIPLTFRKMVIKKFNLGNNTQVVFCCAICGNEHNNNSCPRCGSKMKRGKF